MSFVYNGSEGDKEEVCACVCVCVKEREREIKTKRDSEREMADTKME